jgi:hypothetical protein
MTIESNPLACIVGIPDKWLRQLSKNGVIGKFIAEPRIQRID